MAVITQAEAEIRVARGAALLDQQYPGWADKIDLDRLMLENCHRCVLGQLFGNEFAGVSGFSIGLRALDLIGDSHAHGFCADERSQGGAKSWAVLQTTWVAAVTERRTPRAVWTHRDPLCKPVVTPVVTPAEIS